jgi:cytochrome c5
VFASAGDHKPQLPGRLFVFSLSPDNQTTITRRESSQPTVAGKAAAGDGHIDLPGESGKAVVEQMCTPCHGLENIVRSRKTAKEWGDVVDDMVSRGAQGTDAEIDQVIKYLAKNFGPGSPGATPADNAASPR